MNENLDLNKNTEIEQALKEFEAKEAVPSYQAVKFYNETDTPKIVKLAMKLTGFKEQKQAEYVLFGFVVVAIMISLFLFFGGGQTQQKLSPLQLEQMKQEIIRMEQKL